MISNDEYLASTGEIKSILLPAYSAIDEGLLFDLSSSEIDNHFQRVVLRLATLTSLHGTDTPGNFLRGLATVEPYHCVKFVNNFLWLGTDSSDDCLGARQLQQEIVHFSRIVDIPMLNGATSRGGKRLWRSRRISESLKFLLEHFTVLRSRLLSEGIRLPTPEQPCEPLRCLDIGNTISLALAPTQPSHYAFAITGGARSKRRSLLHLYELLLAHLTPREALFALTAELSLVNTKGISSTILVDIDGAKYSLTTWEDLSRYSKTVPVLESCALLLPRSVSTQGTSFLGVLLGLGEATHLTASLQYTTEKNVVIGFQAQHDPITYSLLLRDRELLPINNVGQVIEHSLSLLAEVARPLASVEFGHIHLDRIPDKDQEISIDIAKSFAYASRLHEPLLPYHCVLLDDDHVLCSLAPNMYARTIEERLQAALPWTFVPESSPLIRAIAFALCSRLKKSCPDKILRKGNNLYLAVDDSVIELIEDIDGRADLGCILFEVAFLIFRSSPVEYELRLAHAAGTESLHTKAIAALSQGKNHVERVALVHSLYSPIEFELRKKVRSPIIAEAERICGEQVEAVHLNILEDYYMTQQQRVRLLIHQLQLPLRLVTLHFNRLTGVALLHG